MLTPELLRKIRAEVLRYVRDNPPKIRATMEQVREYLESLIRYRVRERLGPALEKPPVLGGIGIAYGPDDYDGYIFEFYMDSGFLEGGTFNADTTYEYIVSPSGLYQAPRLDALYPLVQSMSIYVPVGADIVRNGNNPPSFDFDPNISQIIQKPVLWEKTSTHTLPSQLAGNNTGKLKFLAQAKLGLELKNYNSIPINNGAASWSTLGLVTGVDGSYWYARVTDGTSITFTLLSMPIVLRNEIDTAGTPDELLVAEAYGLAYSYETTTEITVNITTADSIIYDGDPWYRSWNFNWDGLTATMTTHRQTGSYSGVSINPVSWQMSLETTVLELQITHTYSGQSGHGFTANIVVGETKNWMFHNYKEFIWYPVISAQLEYKWCPITVTNHPEDLQTTALANGVPIYSYYGSSVPASTGLVGTSNTELVKIQYSRSENSVGAEVGRNCAGFQQYIHCSNTWIGENRFSRNAGDEIAWSGAINGNNISSVTGRDASQSRWRTFMSFSETSRADTYRGGENVLVAIYTCVQTQPLITGCAIDSYFFDCTMVGSPACQAGRIALKIIEVYGDIQYTRLSGSFDDNAFGTAFIFPIDCAEGFVIAEMSQFGGSSVTEETDTMIGAGYAIYDNFVCECTGGQPETEFPNPYAGQQYQLGGGTSSNYQIQATSGYFADGKFYFVGRNFTDTHDMVFSDSADSLSNLTLPVLPFFFPAAQDCPTSFIQIIQGMGDEMLLTGSTETDAVNDFPSNFETVARPATIGLG